MIDLVFLSESWEVNNSSWQVHILAFTEAAGIFACNFDSILYSVTELRIQIAYGEQVNNIL